MTAVNIPYKHCKGAILCDLLRGLTIHKIMNLQSIKSPTTVQRVRDEYRSIIEANKTKLIKDKPKKKTRKEINAERRLEAIERARKYGRKYTLPWRYVADYYNTNICHICGEPVDESDFKVTKDGYFIAGKKYPSTDHVIPWVVSHDASIENSKLAHKLCNSLKSDKLVSA